MEPEPVLLMQMRKIDDTRSERQLAFTNHCITVSQWTVMA